MAEVVTTGSTASMIPVAGETAGAWWGAVGWQEEARASAARSGRPDPDVNDAETLFFHDLPPELAELMRSDAEAGGESPAVFSEPWPREEWPAVATSVLAGQDDRLFPLALQQRVARDRLGLEVEALPGGHLLALSQPRALTDAVTSAAPSPSA